MPSEQSIPEKTLDDCTVEEIGEFVKAASEMLNIFRIYAWQDCAEDNEDTSAIDCLTRMESAFRSIGLDQGNWQEAFPRLERLLTERPVNVEIYKQQH